VAHTPASVAIVTKTGVTKIGGAMKIKPDAPLDPESEPSAINKRLAIRAHDLQHQLQTLQHEFNTLQHEHKLLYSDLCRIAEALGVKEEGFGITGAGIAPSTILERIQELKDASDFFNPR